MIRSDVCENTATAGRSLRSLSLLIVFAACAHGGMGSPEGTGWEPLYGTYEFDGSIRGGQATTTAVSGTLRLADGWYYLTTNQGACDGRLAPTSRTELSWGCRDGIGVAIRRLGDELSAEGTARMRVKTLTPREVCTTDANGNQVCTTKTDRTTVTLRGRITVRMVSGQE